MIRDSSSIYGEMFKALSDVARRHGLNLILYDKNNDPGIEKRCIRNLIDTMAMEIIVVPVSENINGIRRMTKKHHARGISGRECAPGRCELCLL